MPKLKTHSGAKKRFKLTKNGKIKRMHAYKSHILNKKTRKRKEACAGPPMPMSPMLTRSSVCSPINKFQNTGGKDTWQESKAQWRHVAQKKIMKMAKGFWGAKSKQFRTANSAVMRSMANSYIGRKQKKRDFRRL